jgi:hypothetical protein
VGTKKFKYDCNEFFYDGSFDDYQRQPLFDILDQYITYLPTETLNGRYIIFLKEDLFKIAYTLLLSHEFENLKISNFKNNEPNQAKIRLISLRQDNLLQLHSDLEIHSVAIRIDRVTSFCNKNRDFYKTAEVFITATFETLEDMPL